MGIHFHTIFIWLNYALMTWVVVFSLPSTFIWLSETVFYLVIGGLACQLGAERTRGISLYCFTRPAYCYGIPVEDGLAYALLTHESQLIFVAIIGAISFLSFSGKRKNCSSCGSTPQLTEEKKMPKAKTIFVCQNCGVESPKWIGRCLHVKSEYLHEEIVAPASSREVPFAGKQEKRKPDFLIILRLMNMIARKLELQNLTGYLARYVGGSLILLGGEPGWVNQPWHFSSPWLSEGKYPLCFRWRKRRTD